MRFMVMVKATKDSEAGVMPTSEEFAAMGAFNEELVKAGVMEAGEGLHPSARGVRIAFSGRDRRVIEGPFPETSELVAGFWLWKCESLSEAIAWVKRYPNPMRTDSEIEVRQIYTPRISVMHCLWLSANKRTAGARGCRRAPIEPTTAASAAVTLRGLTARAGNGERESSSA